MGLEQLTSDPKHFVYDYLATPEEKRRRAKACERTDLYRDDFYPLLQRMVMNVFREPTVQTSLLELLELVGASNFFKRICDEKARPVYSLAPTRRLFTDEREFSADTKNISPEQEAWNALEKEMHYNARMDLVARLLEAHNDLLILPRYLKTKKRMSLTILTPEMYTVIPDPNDATCASAIFYDLAKDGSGITTAFVGYDDKYIYRGNRAIDTWTAEANPFGRIPAVEVHRRARWGCYWDCTTGNDVVSATNSLMLYDLIILRKIKVQSHLQLAYEGDLEKLVKGQVTDDASVLVATGEGRGRGFHILDLQSDPTKIIAAKQDIMTVCGANHGVSLDRLNQRAVDISEESGLKERVLELAGVMACVETEVFDMVKLVVNADYEGVDIPEDARINVDFGPFLARIDRKTQLENRQTERIMGIRSGVDDVLEDNVEMRGDRKLAMDFIDQKMSEEAVIVERRRALNLPEDAGSNKPGQDPASNGALGPAVRDGQMSRDEAADMATGGDVTTAGKGNRKGY